MNEWSEAVLVWGFSQVSILELKNMVVVLQESWLSAVLRRHTSKRSELKLYSNSTSLPHSPCNTALYKNSFWKPWRTNWLQAASSSSLIWWYLLHLCWRIGYILPKARISSIHCVPIVKYEKTRRELAQPADLESTLLHKVLIYFDFYLTQWC